MGGGSQGMGSCAGTATLNPCMRRRMPRFIAALLGVQGRATCSSMILRGSKWTQCMCAASKALLCRGRTQCGPQNIIAHHNWFEIRYQTMRVGQFYLHEAQWPRRLAGMQLCQERLQMLPQSNRICLDHSQSVHFRTACGRAGCRGICLHISAAQHRGRGGRCKDVEKGCSTGERPLDRRGAFERGVLGLGSTLTCDAVCPSCKWCKQCHVHRQQTNMHRGRKQ